MPSGRTHDLVSLWLAIPSAGAAYYFTRDWALAAVVGGTVLFGGLMFGPDLDTQSKPYMRWGPLRILWWPYKVALPHRSRWSHGILFGTVIRIAYFLAVSVLLLALALYARDAWVRQSAPSFAEVSDAFVRVWEVIAPVRRDYLVAAFIGLWVGAASHTATDVLGSFFKSVKKSF
ncbi:MAG TPA: metal-binding protein [Blastocatellia bacterium]|nr:metal-binding protein [Blastocatellia bacterium]